MQNRQGMQIIPTTNKILKKYDARKNEHFLQCTYSKGNTVVFTPSDSSSLISAVIGQQ
jgi:hypothetical protein